MTPDEIRQRLITIQNMLLDLSQTDSNNIDFLLLYREKSREEHAINYVYNLLNKNNTINFSQATQQIISTALQQINYKEMIIKNEGFIVRCVDNSLILKEHKQIILNHLYNVTFVKNIDNEVYYDLEGVDNNYPTYVGYNSKMFLRLKPLYSFN